MERLKLLEQWLTGLRIAQKAHAQSAAKFQRDDRWLSITALVSSTIVGTSLFTDASAPLAARWKIGAGILSLIVAILSAVQGSLKLGERVSQHRTAMQRYGALRREVELLVSQDQASNGNAIAHNLVESLRKRWGEVDSESPIVPQRLYDQVCASVTEGNLSQQRPASL